jgi:hypothetical protein
MFLHRTLVRYFSINKNYNNKLLINANYNLDLLIKNKKGSYLVNKLKTNLLTKQDNIDMEQINDTIKKIYLSYSIKEALELLRCKNYDSDSITYFEHEYINRYYNNDDLVLLFKEIEQEIKHEYSSRCTFNLLPFYYNIYLNKMK